MPLSYAALLKRIIVYPWEGLGVIGSSSMKTKLLGLLASVTLLGVTVLGMSTVTPACATTFDVTGTFSASSLYGLSGTLDIDVTTGAVTAVDLVVSGPNAIYPANTFTGTESLANALLAPDGTSSYSMRWLANVAGFTSSLDFVVTTSTASLVGFSGGSITQGSWFCSNAPGGCASHITDSVASITGTISPEVSTTPLPAALPLFAAGLGVMGFFGWRRKRNAAALAGT
jgi:hypothetical protein